MKISKKINHPSKTTTKELEKDMANGQIILPVATKLILKVMKLLCEEL